MKSNVIFRMVAYTDAAGKYDPEAPRNGNEDNFFFSYNLSKEGSANGVADVDYQLSDCGLLMVIADGMGGMNAGEIASQIAIDTVSDYFAPGKIIPQLAADHPKRKEYLELVISEADIRIKKDSKHNNEHAGMGSTIILAWIVGNELTLSWCGDSRAYRYNPDKGIELLSKDHSYVQELVDQGLIRYEDTFEHPQGNIITRSLGDISKKAIPETRLYQLEDNDIILLCSDGLSGVLRDKKTYDTDGELIECDNLEDIISANRSSLKKCREALWNAAEKADWYDNVTAIMCEIRSGAGQNNSEKKTDSNTIDISFKGFHYRIPVKILLLSVIGLFIFAFVFLLALRMISNPQPNATTNLHRPMDTTDEDTNSSYTDKPIFDDKQITEIEESSSNPRISMVEEKILDDKDVTSQKIKKDEKAASPKKDLIVSIPTDKTKNELNEIKETEEKFTIQEQDSYSHFKAAIEKNKGCRINRIYIIDGNKEVNIDSINFDEYKQKEVIVVLQKK